MKAKSQALSLESEETRVGLGQREVESHGSLATCRWHLELWLALASGQRTPNGFFRAGSNLHHRTITQAACLRNSFSWEQRIVQLRTNYPRPFTDSAELKLDTISAEASSGASCPVAFVARAWHPTLPPAPNKQRGRMP